MDDPRSALPAVTAVLDRVAPDSRLAPGPLAAVVRDVVGGLRSELATVAPTPSTAPADRDRSRDGLLAEAVVRVRTVEAELLAAPGRAINATGVVLHTGLGRAPLSPRARAAVDAAAGAHAVELAGDGRRGHRDRRPAALLRLLCGAEDATFANNGAGALVLALRAVAGGGRVAVARGELIEIGGSFRLPDVVAAAGVGLHEIGTTNRTHLHDVESALDDGVQAVLVVHPSNYRVSGFVSRPDLAEVVGAAHARGVAVVHDVGSGLLAHPARAEVGGVDGPGDPDEPGLEDEPAVTASLEAGVDLVTASADKLLGGPQAGLVVGSADAVARARTDPLARALRLDKLRVAALVATLQDHLVGGDVPVRRLLDTDRTTLAGRADRLREALAARDVVVDVVGSEAVVGGGSVPGARLPSVALALPPATAARLLAGDPPVLGRVADDTCLLDLRTVEPDDDPDLVEAVAAAMRGPTR